MLLCKHSYINNNDYSYEVQSCNHQGPIYYFISEKKNNIILIFVLWFLSFLL